MSLPLRGGVAVVTGAARGCGLALADVDAAGLSGVAERARRRGVAVSEHRLDVADEGAVAAFPAAVLAEHGRVRVLVNNAGVALGGRFEQTDPADFEWLFSINFWGVVRMTRAFLPVLRREPGAAQIVNLSSVFGIVAPPGQAAYAASKFAVRGFSEALRHELEAEGAKVGVTVVSRRAHLVPLLVRQRTGHPQRGTEDLGASRPCSTGWPLRGPDGSNRHRPAGPASKEHA